MTAEDERRRSPIRFVLYPALAGIGWCLAALLVSFLPVQQDPPLPDFVGVAFVPAAFLFLACLLTARRRAKTVSTPSSPLSREDILVAAVAGLPPVWRVAAGAVFLLALVPFVIAVATSTPGTSGIQDGQYVLWVDYDQIVPITREQYLSLQRQETVRLVGPTLPLYVAAAVLAAGLLRQDPAEVARLAQDRDSAPTGSDRLRTRLRVWWKLGGRASRS
ncbi:MAG TPA: hypothetical protein VIL00_05390 [Pseudonocardiaceae bacterium]